MSETLAASAQILFHNKTASSWAQPKPACVCLLELFVDNRSATPIKPYRILCTYEKEVLLDKKLSKTFVYQVLQSSWHTFKTSEADLGCGFRFPDEDDAARFQKAMDEAHKNYHRELKYAPVPPPSSPPPSILSTSSSSSSGRQLLHTSSKSQLLSSPEPPKPLEEPTTSPSSKATNLETPQQATLPINSSEFEPSSLADVFSIMRKDAKRELQQILSQFRRDVVNDLQLHGYFS